MQEGFTNSFLSWKIIAFCLRFKILLKQNYKIQKRHLELGGVYIYEFMIFIDATKLLGIQLAVMFDIRISIGSTVIYIVKTCLSFDEIRYLCI